MEKSFIPVEDIQVIFDPSLIYTMHSVWIVNFWSLLSIVDWFLPPLEKCPVSFLRDVLSGKKKAKLSSYIILNRLSRITKRQRSASRSIRNYLQGKCGNLLKKSQSCSSIFRIIHQVNDQTKTISSQSWANFEVPHLKSELRRQGRKGQYMRNQK